MKIDTRIVPEGRSELVRQFVPPQEQADWPRTSGGLDCSVTLDRTQSQIHVQVGFSGTLVLECARCLKSFEMPVTGIAVAMLHHASDKNGQAGDDDDVDTDFYYDDRHEEVDISPVLYDELMTAVPLKPLCDETCAGFGPQLPEPGGDDNGQPDRRTDPRWERLRGLKKKK